MKANFLYFVQFVSIQVCIIEANIQYTDKNPNPIKHNGEEERHSIGHDVCYGHIDFVLRYYLKELWILIYLFDIIIIFNIKNIL